MVIANLTYGLANQMFQYAAARALALRNGQKLKLDISFFTNPSTHTHETYGLHIFSGVDEKLIYSPEQVQALRQRYEHKIWHRNINRIRKIISLSPTYSYTWEKEFLTYDPSILHQQGKIIYLTGYFQNEHYFEDATASIRQDFTFRPACISKFNQQLSQQMNNEESVAVHIRRGDYVGNRYVAPVEYYERAIAHLSQKCHNPVFYLFSDDPEWTKQHIRVQATHHYLSHNKDLNSYQDMYLMSNCKHNIIANSSFSWWGAWLNSNVHKIIVTPTQWLPEKGIMTSNIVPTNWVQL